MTQINGDPVEMNDNEIYVEMKYGGHLEQNSQTIKNEGYGDDDIWRRYISEGIGQISGEVHHRLQAMRASHAPACVPTWWIVTSVVSVAVFGTIVTIVAEYKSHTCPSCPIHWVGYNSTCYYFSKAKKNWTASRDACAGERSQLLIISSSWELDFFQMNIKELRWLGLRKNATSDWFWEGGSGIVPKVISNSVVQECGVIGDGRIGASSCSVSLLWICKKHLN